jgi:hypothetical protein
VTYTDEAAFLAAIQPGFRLEQFTTASGVVELGSPAVFAGVDFAFTASATGGIARSSAIGGGYLTVGQNGNFNEPITVSFANSPTSVTAFGANFFNNNNDYSFGLGNLSIVLSDSTTVNINGAALSTFRGFTSDVPIASFTVTATSANHYSSFDNLYMAQATQVIPLPPAAWAGLTTLAGVGLVGFVRRRRQLA